MTKFTLKYVMLSMFYVHKTRETELLTTLATDIGTSSHKELMLE